MRVVGIDLDTGKSFFGRKRYGESTRRQNYLLSVVLQDGRQLSLEVRPADAANIVAGLTKTAGSGAERQQVVALVKV